MRLYKVVANAGHVVWVVATSYPDALALMKGEIGETECTITSLSIQADEVDRSLLLSRGKDA